MNSDMKTVYDIFDVFGGNAAVARILSVGASTASEMKRRASIPVAYWPTLIAAAASSGSEHLTLECMAQVMAGAGARRRAARSRDCEAGSGPALPSAVRDDAPKRRSRRGMPAAGQLRFPDWPDALARVNDGPDIGGSIVNAAIGKPRVHDTDDGKEPA